MRKVPLLDLDFMKDGICRSGAPHHLDILIVGGREAGVQEGSVSSASEGFYTLRGFCILLLNYFIAYVVNIEVINEPVRL